MRGNPGRIERVVLIECIVLNYACPTVGGMWQVPSS